MTRSAARAGPLQHGECQHTAIIYNVHYTTTPGREPGGELLAEQLYKQVNNEGECGLQSFSLHSYRTLRKPINQRPHLMYWWPSISRLLASMTACPRPHPTSAPATRLTKCSWGQEAASKW